MTQLRKNLKSEIIKQYGSVNEWAKEHSISSERFYNFLKGTYNPTVKTLNGWLQTLGMELACKKVK